MVKKLPTGAEQIRSMAACNEQILLGFTNSSEIRVVDGMVCSWVVRATLAFLFSFVALFLAPFQAVHSFCRLAGW